MLAPINFEQQQKLMLQGVQKIWGCSERQQRLRVGCLTGN